jgi:hypothetical protein
MTAADRLADLMTAALTDGALPLAQATPRQPSTAATPEVVDLAITVRRQCAEFVAGTSTGSGSPRICASCSAWPSRPHPPSWTARSSDGRPAAPHRAVHGINLAAARRSSPALIGDTQLEAADRVRHHQHEYHP